MYTLKEIWQTILYRYYLNTFYFELEVCIQLELIPQSDVREEIVYGIAKVLKESYTEATKLIIKESIANILQLPKENMHISIANCITNSCKNKHIIILTLDARVGSDPRDIFISKDLGYLSLV